MSEVTISTQEIRKVYDGGTVALEGVSIDIMDGEWTSIVGPSGSGKTTLLNILSCLDSPSNGEVTIEGTSIIGMGQDQLTRFRKEHIGLVFQQYHLVPYLTALENVMMAQYFHSKVNNAGAEAALEEVGLGHRKHHLPSQLSGGEQQRVCIARALVNEPSILLADEPTGNLDQENGKNVLELIAKLQEQGMTVIMVTHNPEIADMGDRTIEIIDGKVSSDHRTKDV
ncbi:MAG: ABC transporter ATP-binding protein [Thermoplasmata archaeon]|nr:ABC transporter ATP-binding protein [Thermoplasmata archaeon]